MRRMQKKGSIEQGMEEYFFILAQRTTEKGRTELRILVMMPLHAFPVDQGSREGMVQCRASLPSPLDTQRRCSRY